MNTANAVLQLHSRLRSIDEPTSTGNNNLMLKELENAVIMTQTVLTKITARYEKNRKVRCLSKMANICVHLIQL
jgi:hypothetical protein